jgi:xylulokinase
MSNRLVAGVDCSTQATKVLIVDIDSGEVVASGRAPHDVAGTDGARETDPHVWRAALARALAETARAHDVAAISIAAQQHGLVVTDGHGAPLRSSLLWNDTRSTPDAVRLIDELGGPDVWAEEVGSVPVASFTVTKWAYVGRTDPGNAAAAGMVMLPHDWLTFQLTKRPVTDRGDASGTGWWSSTSESYHEGVLALPSVHLSSDVLPEVLGPTDLAGDVTRSAAEDLGLRRGISVGAGTGDNMGAALGLGLGPGEPAMSLGTSGTAYAVMASPAADPTGVVAGFADATGRFLPLACTLNATLAVDRMAAWLGIARDDVEPSGSVVVMPYLDGERTPNLPRAAGTITGLRHSTTPAQILMATYEGAVLSLIDALDRLAEQGSGVAADAPLVLIGGGARGRTWREVVARLSGREMLIPAAQELVALGAAAQAGSLLTGEAPEDVARRWEIRRGDGIEARPRDEAIVHKNAAVRAAAGALNDLGD